MAGEAALELISELRLACNDLFMASLAIRMCGSLVRFNFFVHAGPLEMAALTFGNFLALFVRNLLTVFGAVMTITAFGDVLMCLVRKYSWLRFFCLVFLSLQHHIGWAVVSNNDACTTEKNYAKYTDDDFFGHGVRSSQIKISQKYNRKKNQYIQFIPGCSLSVKKPQKQNSTI